MAGPTKKFNKKGIDVALWPGKTGMTCTIQKRYKDKITQEWKTSTTFFKEDLQALRELLHEALMFYEASDGSSVGMGSVADTVKAAIGSIQTLNFDNDDIPF